MRIGIIGAGAIGMLIANYLGSKHEVTVLVHRKEQQTVIQAKGIGLYENRRWKRSTKVHVLMVQDMIAPLDCCFVCVKQPHILPLIEQINASKLTMPLIFIQNGMGHLAVVKKLQQPVFIGIVEHGATRISENEVAQNGKGKITLAALNAVADGLPRLTKSLHQEDFPFEMVTDWQQLMKHKLLVNSVINPLTALFQVTNGEILSNQSINKLAKNLCREAANTLGLKEAIAWHHVETIATKTSKNTSSMLQDILQKRATEIHAISGFLLQIATSPLPNTSFVYEAIQALERKEKWI